MHLLGLRRTNGKPRRSAKFDASSGSDRALQSQNQKQHRFCLYGNWRAEKAATSFQAAQKLDLERWRARANLGLVSAL